MAAVSLSAQDLINVMKAAAETGVLSMEIGEVKFTRTGYVKPAATDPASELADRARQADQWLASEAPPSAFEEAVP